MRRSITLGLLLVGCGLATPPAVVTDAAHVDAGLDATMHDAGTDAGLDASELDANDRDAGALDANDRDANDRDAGALDASDLDANVPVDSAIVRTADPPTHPSATPIAPFTECSVTTFTDATPPDPLGHVPPCSELVYPWLPPSAGPHFWDWASYGTYSTPVPWGFLVHDMEHGAVVLAYHCENDADCDPVRAEFASIITDHGLDPACRIEVTPSRFIVVPDPTLPVPIAAVAWHHVYEATCLDPTSLRAFVDAHYGMGFETICGGDLDRSDGGWCP